MAEPIGPGDRVRCIANVTPRGSLVTRLTVGAIYTVDAVGLTPPGDLYPFRPWVRLVEAPPRPGKMGFRAELFQPLGGDRADLIESLTRPLETVDA